MSIFSFVSAVCVLSPFQNPVCKESRREPFSKVRSCASFWSIFEKKLSSAIGLKSEEDDDTDAFFIAKSFALFQDAEKYLEQKTH